MSEDYKSMENNRGIQINWGAFNVPTLLAVGTVLWYTASANERQNSRLEAMESATLLTTKTIDAITVKIGPIDNMQYRLTQAETTIIDSDRRLDRHMETVQGIKENVNGLSTKIELLRQAVEQAFPEKATNLRTIPKEYIR